MGKDLSMSYNITCKYGGQHACMLILKTYIARKIQNTSMTFLFNYETT